MIVPSATNFKFKFPEFVQVDDASIEFALEEAVVACGNGDWIDDANQTLALYYYAAHLLMVSIMRAQSGAGQVIESESTPELKVTYKVPDMPKVTEAIDMTMTQYGVRYIGLVRSNFPAVLTIGSAVAM
jgi:hypothetical protein